VVLCTLCVLTQEAGVVSLPARCGAEGPEKSQAAAQQWELKLLHPPQRNQQVLYTHYLERHRNLQYLEAQLEGYHAAEREAMEAEDKRLRKMQRRLA